MRLAATFAVNLAIGLILGLGLMGTEGSGEVILTQPEPTAETINPAAVAQAYADAHGLTSCGAPEDAQLDDVFLTLPSDANGQPTSSRIVKVGLDAALDSAGKRLVILACDKP